MKSIELFQWDSNKKIPCSFPEAHFACIGSKDALIVKVVGGNAQIPNILLQEGKDIMFWFMENGAVADSGRIRIVTRAKPADYIYTETEVITFESLVAKVEDVIAKGNAAADRADTAASKADSSADKANAASGKAAQVEAEIKASEARRVEAEQGRAEAEATRAANETKRAESFNANLVSWNGKVDAACKKAKDTASKAAQDAKTATDAAIAKTEEATNAAVAKAHTATDSATTAANKAEAAVAQLPIPSGNVLKGEAESTFVHVDDAYPAPLVTTKVLGQSNQITTRGVNLFNWNLYLGDYPFIKTNTNYGFWFAKLEIGVGKQATISVNKTCSNGAYFVVSDGHYWDKGNYAWFAHPAIPCKKQATIPADAEGYIWLGFSNTKELIESLYNAGMLIQIELGDKATPYEPFSNGVPSPSPEYPQEITNLNKAELVITGRNICPDAELLGGVSYNSGIPTNKFGIQAKFPYVQPSETYGIGAVLNTIKGVTYSIAYLGKANTAAVGIAEYKSVDDVGDIGKAVSYASVGSSKKISLTASIDGVMVFILASQWSNGTTNLNTFAKEDMIISVGEPCSTYTPHQSKSTSIDLQGNELLSIPNGVRDEVVIDAEGNVSLIKRVAKYVVPENVYAQDESNNFGVQLELNAVDDKYLHKQLCPANAPYNPSVNWMTVFKEGNSLANLQEFKQWFIGTEFYYGTKKPETIPLGKVELPALPEATSNIWNDGNIPASVYIQYLKDVNIAYSDLENQIKQITAALSVMDTPTVIPEMAWGTPAAI